MRTVAAASGAASVRVWHITSRGWDPWTERPLPEVVRVAYPPRQVLLQGDVADAANPPPGCYFHPRCAFAMDACREKRPELREITPGHLVRCYRAEEIALLGIDGGAPSH
jgi:oligopeptide/dipeptide ABC transporter ATP-binding protein